MLLLRRRLIRVRRLLDRQVQFRLCLVLVDRPGGSMRLLRLSPEAVLLVSSAVAVDVVGGGGAVVGAGRAEPASEGER
jgi:hypothetical protein